MVKSDTFCLQKALTVSKHEKHETKSYYCLQTTQLAIACMTVAMEHLQIQHMKIPALNHCGRIFFFLFCLAQTLSPYSP